MIRVRQDGIGDGKTMGSGYNFAYGGRTVKTYLLVSFWDVRDPLKWLACRDVRLTMRAADGWVRTAV